MFGQIKFGFIASAVLSLLTACPPGDSDSSGDSDDTTDTSDTSVHGTALVTVNVFRLDVVVAGVPVTLSSPAKVYSGTSGFAMTIDAPGNYLTEAGTVIAPFAFPVQDDGGYWATPTTTTKVDIGDELPSERLDQFKLFEPGTYRCGYDSWFYSSSAPDHKGAYDDHYDISDQQIDVDHDGRVNPQSYMDMVVIGDGVTDYMKVKGDHLVLVVGEVETDSSSPYYLADGMIAKKNFSVTSVDSVYNYVAEVRCDKQD